MIFVCSHISKKNIYSRRIGPASGRRGSAPFVPYGLNVRLCVLCVLHVRNVRASYDCTSCACCLPTPLFPSSPPGALVTARVRYGADGAPENAGPRPFSPPCPAQRLGAGCLFRHSLPLSPPRPPPHPYPGRVPAIHGW